MHIKEPYLNVYRNSEKRGGSARDAHAMVGRLGPCELGRDKLKRYKKFLDWVGEAESKMRLLGLTTTIEKNSFVQSSVGPELTQFWEKEVRIRWVTTINPAPAHQRLQGHPPQVCVQGQSHHRPAAHTTGRQDGDRVPGTGGGPGSTLQGDRGGHHGR